MTEQQVAMSCYRHTEAGSMTEFQVAIIPHGHTDTGSMDEGPSGDEHKLVIVAPQQIRRRQVAMTYKRALVLVDSQQINDVG